MLGVVLLLLGCVVFFVGFFFVCVWGGGGGCRQPAERTTELALVLPNSFHSLKRSSVMGQYAI